MATDPRSQSDDQHIFSSYLRDLNDPVERMRQGKEWMTQRGLSVTGASEVATVVINCVPEVLCLLSLLQIRESSE